MVIKILAIASLFAHCTIVYSQTDTTFWFAAPEVTYQGGPNVNFDRPIVLRLTTYHQASIVKV